MVGYNRCLLGYYIHGIYVAIMTFIARLNYIRLYVLLVATSLQRKLVGMMIACNAIGTSASHSGIYSKRWSKDGRCLQCGLLKHKRMTSHMSLHEHCTR